MDRGAFAVDATALKRERRARLYSQRELGRLAGVSHETILEVERGQRQRMRGLTVRKLAAALGIAPGRLLKEPGCG